MYLVSDLIIGRSEMDIASFCRVSDVSVSV